MDVDLPDDLHAQLQGLKHDEKWPVLKPVLEPLYYTMKLADIAVSMKKKYGFDAYPHAYKHRFRQWGWKKVVSSKEKDRILDIAQSRTILGKRPLITSNNVSVDPKKLKRYATAMAQRDLVLIPSSIRTVDEQVHILGSFLPFGNRLFANWTMPFGTGRSGRRPQTPSSPWHDFIQFDPPDDTLVRTASEYGNSPETNISQIDAASPLSAAVVIRESTKRANLFLQGRCTELIDSMNRNERSILSMWLYQVWIFCFKTSKHWGEHVQPWTTERLGFQRYQYARIDHSPHGNDHSEATAQMFFDLSDGVCETTSVPGNVCNWPRHNHVDPCDPYYAESDSDASDTDPMLEDILENSLATNSFSSIAHEDLPLSTPKIAKAVQGSTETLLQESLAFAIMACNSMLVKKILRKIDRAQVNLSNLFPFHIATSYLDGNKTCCEILHAMDDHLGYQKTRKLNYNNHGHTILDNLMLTILRSHSTADIGDADASLKHNARYAGIEVDICGRWDADSPCLRSLVASGMTAIPKRWKHKFCHTSVQAVCHSIKVLGSWPLYQPSGLFLKHCRHCGMKLQLGPLHTLVMTGYVLANNCCSDEDLFGIIACFLCLFNPMECPPVTAPISISSLLDQDNDGDHCDHVDLSPCELAKLLAKRSNPQWSIKLQTGWRLLCKIADIATAGRESYDHDHMQDEDVDEIAEGFRTSCPDFHPWPWLAFGSDLVLGHVWAAMQTELSCYRRTCEEDPWLSSDFDMSRLLHSLETDASPAIAHVEQGLMCPYCRCG